VVDSTKLRAIGQAWLYCGSVNPGGLAPENLTDVYALAAAIAREGGISLPGFWISRLDPAVTGTIPTSILSPSVAGAAPAINPQFLALPLSVAVALVPNPGSLPSSTPIAWTRGLQADGTWRKDSPYGGTGGNIFFADGQVRQYAENKVQLVKWETNIPTSNIAEALPPGTRIGESAASSTPAFQPLPILPPVPSSSATASVPSVNK